MCPVLPPAPRRPGRPVRPDNAAMRADLLGIATGLFAAQGVAATTIAHIAQRAAVTPAMVHYYFKNRDQLIDAVVQERVLPVIGYVWAPVPVTLDAGQDPAAAARGFLAEIVKRIVQSATQQPWLPALWMHEVVNEGGQLRERVLPHLPSDRCLLYTSPSPRD